MEFFNSVITSLFSLSLQPLAGASPLWGLSILSIVAGIVLVIIYGRISNQSALKTVKKRITAGIYESVLFRHDLPTSLKAQGGMLIGGARYFALAVPPLIVLLIPSLVILAQLNLRYGARSLQIGEQAIISVALNDEDALFETELHSTSEALQLTPPLRDLNSQSVSWRVDSVSGGNSSPLDLTLSVNGNSVKQPIYTGLQPVTLPTAHYTSPWWQFLYPGATVQEELRQHVNAITISYPEQELAIAGVAVHWLLFFVIVSIASGLIASKVIGIEV